MSTPISFQKPVLNLTLFLMIFAIATTLQAQIPYQSPLPDGKLGVFISLDPEFVSISINLNVNLNTIGEKHSIDYKAMRASISKKLNPNIKDIAESAGSLIKTNEQAKCQFDDGGESIYDAKELGLRLDIMCENIDELTDITINFFDIDGIESASALILTLDEDLTAELDAQNRVISL